jgi:hypothetical protein
MAIKNSGFSLMHIPWFMLDLNNYQLITTPLIPSSDITTSKEIVLAETPIPGLGFSPIASGGFGNKKISFTLPLVKKNNSVGNLLLLQQFENLRNPVFGLTGIFQESPQFTPNPKVLYFWGTGSGVPLEYFVAKCDPVHHSSFVNAYGYPQYSEISIELILDETSPLNKAEGVFRKLSGIISTLSNAYNITQQGGIQGVT